MTTSEFYEVKNHTIKQLWLEFSRMPTDDITELEAEIWALITCHPAIQKPLEDENIEYICPKCAPIGAMHDHAEWKLCDKHDERGDHE